MIGPAAKETCYSLFAIFSSLFAICDLLFGETKANEERELGAVRPSGGGSKSKSKSKEVGHP